MHHYRQALVRTRQGDSDRDIAAARLMGRPKAAKWRHIARAQGWLDPTQALPDDQAIAAVLQGPRRACSTVSGTTINQAISFIAETKVNSTFATVLLSSCISQSGHRTHRTVCCMYDQCPNHHRRQPLACRSCAGPWSVARPAHCC